IRAGYLLLVHQGHKEVRRAKQQGAVKSERRYANDGEGMFIQLNHAAGNAGIIVKMGVPKGVVEDDIGCAVGATLVGGVEKTAQIRVKAKHIEIVPCNFVEPNAVWIITCVESCLINVITCQIVKTVIAVAEIEIVGVGIVPQLITGPLDSVKALRLRHIQRAQDHCIQDSKNNGIGADAESQREYRGEGEAGRFAQHAEGVTNVLQQSFDEVRAEGFADFFLIFLVAAEFDARAPFGFSARHAGTLEIIGAILDVRPKLLFHIVLNLRTIKKLGGDGAKVGRQLHISPLHAHSNLYCQTTRTARQP